MLKIIRLKNIQPEEALKSVRIAGVFGYMINWGCEIDKANRQLIFTLKHGGGSGGSCDEELRTAATELEKFIRSIDLPDEKK